MKRAFFVFSMLSLSGATTLAQDIYVHVEQEGKRLEQLGTAKFEVNADSHPCVEFVNGKAVMTIKGANKGKYGFYRFTGTTLNPGLCYLEYNLSRTPSTSLPYYSATALPRA